MIQHFDADVQCHDDVRKEDGEPKYEAPVKEEEKKKEKKGKG